jgi:hypothetical protein
MAGLPLHLGFIRQHVPQACGAGRRKCCASTGTEAMLLLRVKRVCNKLAFCPLNTYRRARSRSAVPGDFACKGSSRRMAKATSMSQIAV